MWRDYLQNPCDPTEHATFEATRSEDIFLPIFKSQDKKKRR